MSSAERFPSAQLAEVGQASRTGSRPNPLRALSWGPRADLASHAASRKRWLVETATAR